MTSQTPRTSPLSLILHAVTIGMLAIVLMRDRQPEAQAEEETVADLLSDFSEEVSMSAYELKAQSNRLTRMLDKLQREGFAAPQQTSLTSAPHADVTTFRTADLIARLLEVNDLHDKFKTDPIQRVPIEKERGRIEEELRGRGDDAVDAVGNVFHDVPNTKHQTRLLTHIVDPIETDLTYEFAKEVFEDESINDGVRLVAARIAMEKWPDEINDGLVAILSDPDVGFKRMEQIIVFFKQNPYPPAADPLCDLAVNPEFNRQLRRYCLQTLGVYPEPKVVEALKTAASDVTQGRPARRRAAVVEPDPRPRDRRLRPLPARAARRRRPDPPAARRHRVRPRRRRGLIDLAGSPDVCRGQIVPCTRNERTGRPIERSSMITPSVQRWL